MSALDDLSVKLTADADSLFSSLDEIDARLSRLRNGGTVPLPAELEIMLTAAADGAISDALSSAGDTLAAAVRDHDVQLSSALAAAESALARSLQSAVSALSAAFNVTVPVYIDSSRVATAVLKNLKSSALRGGRSLL